MEFVDLTPRFAKAPGGNVRVSIVVTDETGGEKPLLCFVMARESFSASIKAALGFEEQLRVEEAECFITTLSPRKRRAKN